MSTGRTKLRHFVDAIKFEHTVFALPFAYIAMVLAAGGWPGWWTVAWVTAAMAGARHLPRGLLRAGELTALAAAGAALMFVAAWMLNPLCLKLAPLALVFLVGYSYTKYVTWTSHWILGFTDGIAAAGGWVAVCERLDPPALVLWFALTVWIAGFDLIYACQDVAFDRARGLHSVPARFGVAAALAAARVNHVLTAAALGGLGVLMGLGPLYWVGWLAIAGLLAYEHSLVRADDLSRLDMAFFNVNGYIAVIALVSVVIGLRR
ncbi:MAG: hypothetical protein AUH30_14415 [Candidatus Rokubacteria bacterium 13_1_40CM_68_15]|nr:MAG: hypothetical protein AUH30_14415 [Candidatus Rokubacteria bacterium 13_1_40CM_68_15]